jgi:L-asparaginase
MSSNCIFSQFLIVCKENLMQQPKLQGSVVLLATGGTIAGIATDPTDNVGYVAGKLSVDELVATVPASLRAGLSLVTEQVSQIDSKDMTYTVWAKLLQRASHWLADPEVRGLVITHGTDTLEETAYFLHLTLATNKPVVFTCAMRPDSAALRDGPQNLADALVVACSASARGVVVVCAGVVHAAAWVQKAHTYRLDAFSSGAAGPLGYVEEGILRSVAAWPEGPAPKAPASLPAPGFAWPRVEIVQNHVQADGWLPRAMLAADGLHGIVVAGTGNGSLSVPLEQALKACEARGVRVLRVSRCPDGPLLAAPQAAFPGASGLSAVKARVWLTLDLMREASSKAPATPFL